MKELKEKNKNLQYGPYNARSKIQKEVERRNERKFNENKQNNCL